MVHLISAGTPTGAVSDRRLAPLLAASAAVDRDHPGICFAKSYLLAAVLRACGIATGLCHQKLAGGERTYLHALNGRQELVSA